MKKVYKLLRNNLEKGPFTFDELLQQHLLTSDLIWIDGRSAAWMNAREVSELKNCLSIIESNIHPIVREEEVVPAVFTHAVSEQPMDVAKYISGPALSEEEQFERRADELKKTTLAYKPSYLYIPSNSNSKPFLPAIENDIDIIYYRKEKYLYAPHILIAALIFIFFVAAWNKIGLPAKNDREDKYDVAAKPYISEEPQAPVIKQIATENDLSIMNMQVEESVSTEIVKKKPVAKKANAATSVPIKASVTEKGIEEETMPVKNEEITILSEDKMHDVIQDNIKTITNETALPVEKKKTLGKALKGLFKKKNKEKAEEVITP